MLVLRSFIFNVIFYINLILWLAITLPLSFFIPQRAFFAMMKAWCASSLWLLEHVVHIKMEVHGQEYMAGGPFIIASKHQSLFETFALFYLFGNPAFILKRELMLIPLVGWTFQKMGMISINREAGNKEGRSLIRKAHAVTAQGRSLIIFPEGTRRAPGAPPRYKTGFSLLYKTLHLPCLPIALNSGCHWPRRSFLRYPGTIHIVCLPPVPAGLHPKEALALIQDSIERESNRLLLPQSDSVAH